MQKEPEKLIFGEMVKCDRCDGRGYQMQKSSIHYDKKTQRLSKKEKVKCPRCFGRGVMNKQT